ncbi:MAG: hypothetical protein AABW50_02345, partial [Nanoarchaeota archaeon]
MVFKRYIYRNGKRFGPYYYHNKKVDGKVISNYVGTSDPKNKKTIKIAIIVLSIISIVLLVYVASVLKLFPTGEALRDKSAVEIPDIDSKIQQTNTGEKTSGKEVSDSKSITGTIPGEKVKEPVPADADISVSEPTVETTQLYAKINEPVKWKKEISLEKEGLIRVQLPKEAENIIVYKIDKNGERHEVSGENVKITAKASSEIILDKSGESSIVSFFKKIFDFITGRAVKTQESESGKEITLDENVLNYEIEYETPAPTLTEEKTSRGKRIKLNSPEGFNYENVLVSTVIGDLEITSPETLRIYWVEKNEYISYQEIKDTNENGIYDYIEWVAPSSDNQTFEIIVITKADHLDENRAFVSDIYEELKELDNIWSETISQNDFVRVTFERNLTSGNDITIFPRITEGNPKIEVYEKDENDLVAEFESILSNEYNKVYLSNLEGEQDTFDLKVVRGSLEFDYVVDPVFEGDGRIIYGEGTVVTPRTRVWFNSTQSWEDPESSLNSVAATSRHVVIKSSPRRDEILVGIQTTGGQLYIQRWNGSIWTSEWNVAVGNGNLPRFDIVYEQNSGEALVVYGTNTATTNEIAYRIWDGNSWAGPTNYNALRTSGIIQGLSMVSLNNSNDIAVVWGDSNLDLSANYWNGASNSWVAEPSAALSTGVDTLGGAASLTTWSFDIEFESLSGELLIAWGNAASLDVNYVTRGAGAGGVWGSVLTAAAFNEQSGDLELSSDPTSNRILFVHGGGIDSGNDMEFAIWDGTAFPTTLDTNPPCIANAICADLSVDITGAGTTNNAGGWLSDSGNVRAIVTYDDNNNAGVDWIVWDSSGGWVLQPDCTTACNSQPASGNDLMHRIRVNPLNPAELMFIGIDINSDLYAKKLTLLGTALTWSSTEPSGLALETTVSVTSGFPADFAYNKFIDTQGPAISSPNTNSTLINQNE